ncbi:MAG: DegT/DnrJ/EryC1/StrS family aminotransferase [Verrucomicrobiaceae bacterium]|nr:DegT/DnrJ/EryC1/StrS family aminotransferase [Verrucomicrobiaceae bacterium]
MSTSPAPSLFTHFPIEDYRHHEAEIDAALRTMLHGGHYILGPEVDAFEREFAAFIGARHAIGVANGTDAIELILRALDIGPGDRVVVPSHTAVASASGISRAGAEPVFVDVDPLTCTMCPEALEALLASDFGQEVKAVLAVHIYGQPVAWSALKSVADKHGVLLLEDCAQAHGATFEGNKAGALGLAAAFSFYPTKNLGAIGDGGAITTSDDALAERIRVIRQYGWKERYISHCEGVNSRLDEMQAAILRVKLRTLPAQIRQRRAVAAAYARGLAGLPGVDAPVDQPGCTHAYHLYVIRCAARDALMKHLQEQGVPVALHYPAAIHQQPGYAHITARSPALPQTEMVVSRILTLPLHPYLSPEAVTAVCQAIHSFAQSQPR